MSVLGSCLLPCLKEVLSFVSSFLEILSNGTKQALPLRCSQIPCSGAGEMAQPFRALALPEDIAPSVLAPSWGSQLSAALASEDLTPFSGLCTHVGAACV